MCVCREVNRWTTGDRKWFCAGKMDGDMSRVEHPVPSTILHTHTLACRGNVSVLPSDRVDRRVNPGHRKSSSAPTSPFSPFNSFCSLQSSLNLKLYHVSSAQNANVDFKARLQELSLSREQTAHTLL